MLEDKNTSCVGEVGIHDPSFVVPSLIWNYFYDVAICRPTLEVKIFAVGIPISGVSVYSDGLVLRICLILEGGGAVLENIVIDQFRPINGYETLTSSSINPVPLRFLWFKWNC